VARSPELRSRCIIVDEIGEWVTGETCRVVLSVILFVPSNSLKLLSFYAARLKIIEPVFISINHPKSQECSITLSYGLK
jgi:hypothetical protein